MYKLLVDGGNSWDFKIREVWDNMRTYYLNGIERNNDCFRNYAYGLTVKEMF